MIFRTNAKTKFKRDQIRCNTMGAFVCIKWQEWTSSAEPDYDPTSGALLTAGTGDVPEQSFCRTRCFVHFVGPTLTMARKFAEIQEGDAIVDFVTPLLQIANPGATSFSVGQIVDLFAFGAANRALASGQTLATAFPGCVKVESLQNPSVWIYSCKDDWLNDTNGEEYFQAQIGKDLAQSWSTLFAGILLGESFLFRKAT